MKKIAMTLILFILASITTGCSHAGWVNFEEQTRIPGMFGGPMAAVNLIAKVGTLVVRDDVISGCRDCTPAETPPGDEIKE